MKPHDILFHPYVTEKTLNMLQGTPAQNLKDGKHAIIKLAPEFSAEEIGMRIGVF